LKRKYPDPNVDRMATTSINIKKPLLDFLLSSLPMHWIPMEVDAIISTDSKSAKNSYIILYTIIF